MKGPQIEWSVAAETLPGQPESGDCHVVRPIGSGLLVAVVDGLGHGSEAAQAARVAIATLESAVEPSLVALCEMCHTRLRATRGAVMSLAWIDGPARTMTWLGVGNVEGRLVRGGSVWEPSYLALLLRPGVLGHRAPPLYPATVAVAPGDTLLLATDGIEPGFVDSVRPKAAPRVMAERILANHGKRTDDALVLALRYLGPG